MPDMGTKTADETGAETGAEATTDEQKVSVAKTDEVTEAEAAAADEIDDESADEPVEAGQKEGPSGVGQGAGAVVSAALGLVSLTGSWIGTVASARQSLIGQLHAQTATSSDVAKLLDEGYGDAWKATALWGGVFALFALVVGVAVLARPAFGAPGRPQAGWIKSVAWGGVALGVVGLLLAVLKYTGVLLDLPSAG
ncbi:putative membrane protein YdbT with pleckstrin-like domain [Streptomyces sp. SAI-208]|nr:putative membrane protein YdbT with pleckstrin-like domain [Streptomyces sp. SAI-041]MDH6567611.1 putative membrane protein YdbT with pleckstrin-like domain [Streptomyces sp. SAI-117]MDH6607127.1 putative membrane protein YdbT with pleckstrin-like domain [Streptomyces sp. SAI-208]